MSISILRSSFCTLFSSWIFLKAHYFIYLLGLDFIMVIDLPHALPTVMSSKVTVSELIELQALSEEAKLKNQFGSLTGTLHVP